MTNYKIKTGRGKMPECNKLMSVMKAKKILLYTPMIAWYLEKGLKVTAVYEVLQYEASRPFSWFVDEVYEARSAGDRDVDVKALDD